MATKSEPAHRRAGEPYSRTVLVVGFLLTGLALVLQTSNRLPGGRIDNYVFDRLSRLNDHSSAPEQVVIVDIDEIALSAVGQWPWPRYLVATLIKAIDEASAQVIGVDILFPEPDRTSLSTLRHRFRHDFGLDLHFSGIPAGLEDNDGYLGSILGSTNTVGSIFFYPDLRNTTPPCILSPVHVVNGRHALTLPEAKGMLCNTPKIQQSLRNSGFINAAADSDGTLRRLPMLYVYKGQIYPSFALAVLLRLTGLDTVQIVTDIFGPVIRVGHFSIPVDPQGQAMLRFQSPIPNRQRLSALDILRKNFKPENIADQVVLIGSTAVGLAENFHSAITPQLSGTEANAVLINDTLNNAFYREPAWQTSFNFYAILFTGLIVAVLFAKFSALRSTLGVLVLATALVGLSLVLFVAYGVILHITAPLLVLTVESGIFSFLLYRRHEQIAAESCRIRDKAEAANQAKSEFLARMSHEIRSPLHCMLTAAELLRKSALDAQQQKHVEIIQNSGQTLLAIINDILDLSKIEAKQQQSEVVEFKLFDFLDTLVQQYRIRAHQKDLQLFCNIAPQIRPHLRGDSRHLKQVLINLIDNAIKFTPCGEIVLTVSVKEEKSSSITLLFSIADSGIGIPEERLDEIFHPFVQADESTTRKYGGTGLGLAISANLIELMGGKYGVESKVGQGSHFWFTAVFDVIQDSEQLDPTPSNLPGFYASHKQTELDRNLIATDTPNSRQITNWPPKPPRANEASYPAAAPLISRRHPYSILVADDSPINLELMAALLKQLGYRADTVSNGKECLEALKRKRYDLILMDCLMPEMDGYEATRQIRRGEQSNTAGSALPIIALSANAIAGEHKNFLLAGMNDYLSKPVDVEQLKQVLSAWLSHAKK